MGHAILPALPVPGPSTHPLRQAYATPCALSVARTLTSSP